jgi:predicted PurR-regulated permease PerM
MPQRSGGHLVFAFVSGAIILYALYELRHVWLIFYVAVVLAIMFDPAVRLVGSARVRGWRPGRGVSVAIVSLIVLAIFAAVAAIVIPPVAGDARRLEQQWPQMSANAFGWIHDHLPFSRAFTADSVRGWWLDWTNGSPARTFSTSLFDILTTLLLAIYLLVDGRSAFNWGMSWMPARYRAATRDALVRGSRRMQHWVGGQGLLMLTHGGSALVTFWLLGLPYFVPIAVFAALINVIPFLGPILTLIAAGGIAAMETPGKLPGVIIFYLAYHNIEGVFLQPKIMSHAVGVPGLTVIAALVIGYQIAGIVGMIVAVPTAVLIAELRSDLG